MSRTPFLSGKLAASVLRVSAGILVDAAQQILIAERKGDAAFANHWEFPGGKIAPGESAVDALHRELSEELGIRVLNFCHFHRIDHVYPDREVSIDFYVVDAWDGEPRGLLGQALQWRHVEDIDATLLLPADAPVVRALQKQVRAGDSTLAGTRT